MMEQMENLNGSELNSLPIPGLSLVSHLIYFEGPLLSQLRAKNGSVYFKYWCDCDDNFNRWMYFRVLEQDRLRALIGEKNLYDIIVNNPDCFVFFCDENDVNKVTRLVSVADIPLDYLPDEEFFLDYVEISERSTAMVFEDQWEFDQLKELYRKFSQVYDFICVSSKQVHNKFSKFPWQGGFSSIHFYNSIKDFIPNRMLSGLDSIHYASPGYMKINTDPVVSQSVFEAIQDYYLNREKIDSLYSNLQSIIRGLELNKLSHDLAVENFDKDSICMQEYIKFSNSFKHVDIGWFNLHTEHNFERCKILMAHYRRINALTQFIQEGTVRFLTDKLNIK